MLEFGQNAAAEGFEQFGVAGEAGGIEGFHAGEEGFEFGLGFVAGGAGGAQVFELTDGILVGLLDAADSRAGRAFAGTIIEGGVLATLAAAHALLVTAGTLLALLALL